jgi:hypothetical protein
VNPWQRPLHNLRRSPRPCREGKRPRVKLPPLDSRSGCQGCQRKPRIQHAMQMRAAVRASSRLAASTASIASARRPSLRIVALAASFSAAAPPPRRFASPPISASSPAEAVEVDDVGALAPTDQLRRFRDQGSGCGESPHRARRALIAQPAPRSTCSKETVHGTAGRSREPSPRVSSWRSCAS